MAKAKHTEGPWEFVLAEPDGPFCIAAGGYAIAKMCAAPGPHNKANARMMATSLELYEALDELYRHVQFIVSIAPHYSEMVEAALKKARGEQ